MKVSMISKFIEDCNFHDATIYFKENQDSPLCSILGVSDVDSSSQVIYLDAGHEDEHNVPISGSKLIELLEDVESNYNCQVSMLEGYCPNMENEVLDVNHIRIDLLNDGSRQVHLVKEVNDE